MLQQLISTLPRGNAKTVNNWKQVTDNLKIRTEHWLERFDLSMPSLSTGIELIKFILYNVDIDSILSIPSDADKFSKVIAFIPDALRQSYDPVYSNTVPTNYFATTRGTPEIILNSSLKNPIKVYPFDQPFDKGWSGLRGTTVLYHTGNELLSNLLNWKIDFVGADPSRLTFEFDITTLIFKYIKYIQQCNQQGTQPSITTFIQKYELRYWFLDFQRIWNINFVSSLLIAKTEEQEQYLIYNTVVPQFYSSISQIVRAASDVLDTKTLLKTGRLTVQDFLATNWASYGSFINEINDLEYRQLPQLRQYKHLQFLKEQPYLVLLFGAISQLEHSSTQYEQLNRWATFHLRNFQREGIGGSISHPKVRTLFNNEMNMLEELLT